jgi:hypothetical protein
MASFLEKIFGGDGGKDGSEKPSRRQSSAPGEKRSPREMREKGNPKSPVAKKTARPAAQGGKARDPDRKAASSRVTDEPRGKRETQLRGKRVSQDDGDSEGERRGATGSASSDGQSDRLQRQEERLLRLEKRIAGADLDDSTDEDSRSTEDSAQDADEAGEEDDTEEPQEQGEGDSRGATDSEGDDPSEEEEAPPRRAGTTFRQGADRSNAQGRRDAEKSEDEDSNGSRRNGRDSSNAASSTRISGSEAIRHARVHLSELLGRDPETVSGLSRTADGWRVAVEVVELERIPQSTDILATYEVEIDGEGELIAYDRVNRYYRNQPGGGE